MRYMENHDRQQVAKLEQLWMDGLSMTKIAKIMGVGVTTIGRWARHYKLPERLVCQSQEDAPAPSREDDEASMSGLPLSPWVEERARLVREAHYEKRRAECPATSKSKANHRRRIDRGCIVSTA